MYLPKTWYMAKLNSSMDTSYSWTQNSLYINVLDYDLYFIQLNLTRISQSPFMTTHTHLASRSQVDTFTEVVRAQISMGITYMETLWVGMYALFCCLNFTSKSPYLHFVIVMSQLKEHEYLVNCKRRSNTTQFKGAPAGLYYFSQFCWIHNIAQKLQWLLNTCHSTETTVAAEYMT